MAESDAKFRKTPPSPNPPEGARRYINRELSWLKFNERVLEEARNPSHPLIERLRFLSISGSNLDEFFMVRVAGLVGQVAQGVELCSPDGLTPAQQLEAIYEQSDRLMQAQQQAWEFLRGALEEEGVAVVMPSSLDEEGAAWLRDHFNDQIFPILTPQALDPAHPFPFIPNLGLSIVLDMKRQKDGRSIRELLMIPAALPRFLRVPGGAARYVTIEDTVLFFVERLFPGYDLIGSGTFRIVRDSDIEVEEEAEDLVRYFKSAIKRRRKGQVIRLELNDSLPDAVSATIREDLLVVGSSRALVHGFIGISDLAILCNEDRPDLKFPAFTPRFPERIREYDGDCFAAIQAKDIIVHHPYESFDVVVAMIEQAASDPDVVAIKLALYRAGRQSRIIRALIDAAEAGKSVTAVVELKARFDEEQNLAWAAQLERAGVQVVYGFIEWKTHAKVTMIVRKEEGGYRTYCHFGTGNYHPVTAKIYTDLSYFTADPAAGHDAAQLFNYITGYVEPGELSRISISPVDLRQDLEALIAAEMANAAEGKPAAIWAKMNSLVDAQMIDRLYEASQAGVQIDLVVRGICCLRPGIAGLSENIRVKSVIGRFLEHSRIWAFANGRALPNDGAKLFISSADWMPRNLERRVEYMMPIANPTVHDQVLDQVMVANLIDNEQSWEMDGEGQYERVQPEGKRFNLHQYFMTNPSLSGRGKALKKSKSVPKLRLDRRKPK
ncbi:RNA degradosome polyphosphate kinase [Novosphingopyxis sp. YJ-S2-01]|uniref:RNA degradosome polyphosphate kinase n=1 Tax=Novosphingopyxis sp. YJ-S2-01 TaxID=2794021 RepID=UPI0018DDC510|nr:RNA degradosome polyphosphate kinase [Novosphingopyxis sp. YJ-S2-01]MBH9537291.1 RNA degradosome polyphosphate kinase [Novosphingopyxis sp. YJ-S2-01]